MAEVKRRVGRPRVRAEDERRGDRIGLRCPRVLKDKLVEAAVAAGRSLSTEAQVRLERTFIEDAARREQQHATLIQLLRQILPEGEVA